MGIRDLIRKNASKFLEPGETIQVAFSTQTGPNPNYMFITWLVTFFSKFFSIVATDRRILLLKSSVWKRSAVKELVATYPRETRLGPATGRLWAKIELGGNEYWVHRRFFKDVQAADSSLQQTAAEPTTA